MIHPWTRVVRIDDSIGDGVVATARIPRGTIVWARDATDVVLSVDEVAALAPGERERAMRYGYRNRWGATILCSDAGRLVNHSCEPTSRGIGHDAQIAVRDIEIGEEVTCDYAECNLTEPMPCECNTPSCRGEVLPDDLRRYSTIWDLEVAAAIHAQAAHQPLLEFAVDSDAMRAIVEGHAAPLPLLEVSFLRPGPTTSPPLHAPQRR